MKEKISLSIVIPCYNEEGGLYELHRRLTGVCQSIIGEPYEIVLVNDGSTDKTWEVMKRLAASDFHLVLINLSRNFGHQAALSAGLQISRGERVFILDADLQDPPELLPKMLVKMNEGFDVVFGQRIKREGESFFKKKSAYMFYRFLNWLTEIKIPKDTGDFRLMSRRTVNMLNSMPEHYRFIRGMVTWIGFRQAAIFYERDKRFDGSTKYTLRKMISFAFDAITAFSIRPLRLATYLGFIFGISALLILFYVFISYFTHHTTRGWTSLAAIMLTIGSVQMIIIGLMGEYLGRLYIESKHRPLFIIQEVVSSQELLSSLTNSSQE